MSVNPLDAILKERGSKYGPFNRQALWAQGMKEVFRLGCAENPQFKALSDEEKATVMEGAEMILHKLSRAANGDPLMLDTWEDIAGYATAVINNLRLRDK